MTRLGLLVGCIVSIAIPALAWQNTPSDADGMLAEINNLRPPTVDQSKRNDPGYARSYMEQRNAYMENRSSKIKAFFDKYPDHPQAWPLMQERWMMQLSQSPNSDAVIAEIDQLLAKQKDDA